MEQIKKGRMKDMLPVGSFYVTYEDVRPYWRPVILARKYKIKRILSWRFL